MTVVIIAGQLYGGWFSIDGSFFAIFMRILSILYRQNGVWLLLTQHHEEVNETLYILYLPRQLFLGGYISIYASRVKLHGTSSADIVPRNTRRVSSETTHHPSLRIRNVDIPTLDVF